MAAKFIISDIKYLNKPVKDYQKPFRFTLTAYWLDEKNREQGFDIVGCLGGVGRDGKAGWNGPMYWMGRKAAYSVHIAPGTYDDILGALVKGKYFKERLEDLLPGMEIKTKAVPADEEYGLPTEIRL